MLMRGMHVLLDLLNSIKNTVKMDSNYFYPALVTFIIGLLPCIKELFTTISNKRKNNLLELHRTEEVDYFYVQIMIIELIMTVVDFLCAAVISSVINMVFLIFQMKVDAVVLKILMCAFSVMTGCLLIKFVLMKMIFVRKRMLGNAAKKWLLYAPIIIFNIYIIFQMVFPGIMIALLLILILMITCELIGLCCFWGRYISYKYSSLTIFTKAREQIECKDISKIRRKKDIVVIEKENCEIYVRYEDITRIEYSGKELIKLKSLIG